MRQQKPKHGVLIQIVVLEKEKKTSLVREVLIAVISGVATAIITKLFN